MSHLPALDDTGAVMLLILAVIIGLIVVGIVSAVREMIGR